MAVGAAALGFFYYVRRWQLGPDGATAAGGSGAAGGQHRRHHHPAETHARTETAPTTWRETIYLFREALRYVWLETLGRWRAVDLFFGLAYLSRRDGDEYPAADIAAAGAPVCEGLGDAEARALLEELRLLRRMAVYCQGLRHHGAAAQRRHWTALLGTCESSDEEEEAEAEAVFGSREEEEHRGGGREGRERERMQRG